MKSFNTKTSILFIIGFILNINLRYVSGKNIRTFGDTPKPATVPPILYMYEPFTRASMSIADSSTNEDKTKKYLYSPYNTKDSNKNKKLTCLNMNITRSKTILYRGDGIVLYVKSLDLESFNLDEIKDNSKVHISASFYESKKGSRTFYELANSKVDGSKNALEKVENTENKKVNDYKFKIESDKIPLNCPFTDNNGKLGKDCHLILRFQFDFFDSNVEIKYDNCADIVLYD